MKIHSILINVIDDHYSGTNRIYDSVEVWNALVKRGASENEAHTILWEYYNVWEITNHPDIDKLDRAIREKHRIIQRS